MARSRVDRRVRCDWGHLLGDPKVVPRRQRLVRVARDAQVLAPAVDGRERQVCLEDARLAWVGLYVSRLWGAPSPTALLATGPLQRCELTLH